MKLNLTREEVETLISALDTHSTTVLVYLRRGPEKDKIRKKYERIEKKLAEALAYGLTTAGREREEDEDNY